MVMTTIAMCMTVIYFFLCSVAFFCDLNIKMQGLTREWVITVNEDFFAEHICNTEDWRSRFITGAELQARFDIRTRRE